MKRYVAGLLLIASIVASGCAPVGMSAMVQVRSAPPPPAFAWRAEPRFVYLSDYRLSVIADETFGYDLFGCGGYYYLYSGGYWYRSPVAQGPFVAIEVRRVPRQIFEVDDHSYHWRSHPQGWRGAQQRGDENHGRHRGRGRNRGGEYSG